MSDLSLEDKCVLITGAARRGGRILALPCATVCADVVFHHGHSDAEADESRDEITGLWRQAWIFKAELNDSEQTRELIPQINASAPGHGFVNSAAIANHFPYTISKALLAAKTQSLAITLARRTVVNGLGLGAIRPSSDRAAKHDITKMFQ